MSQLQKKRAQHVRKPTKSDQLPMPEGWRRVKTDYGRPFFVEVKTKTTSWIDPRDLQWKKKTWDEVDPNDPEETPYGWEIGNDPLIGRYYIDHLTRRNLLEDPRAHKTINQLAEVKQFVQEQTHLLENAETEYQRKLQELKAIEQEAKHLRKQREENGEQRKSNSSVDKASAAAAPSPSKPIADAIADTTSPAPASGIELNAEQDEKRQALSFVEAEVEVEVEQQQQQQPSEPTATSDSSNVNAAVEAANESQNDNNEAEAANESQNDNNDNNTNNNSNNNTNNNTNNNDNDDDEDSEAQVDEAFIERIAALEKCKNDTIRLRKKVEEGRDNLSEFQSIITRTETRISAMQSNQPSAHLDQDFERQKELQRQIIQITQKLEAQADIRKGLENEIRQISKSINNLAQADSKENIDSSSGGSNTDSNNDDTKEEKQESEVTETDVNSASNEDKEGTRRKIREVAESTQLALDAVRADLLDQQQQQQQLVASSLSSNSSSSSDGSSESDDSQIAAQSKPALTALEREIELLSLKKRLEQEEKARSELEMIRERARAQLQAVLEGRSITDIGASTGNDLTSQDLLNRVAQPHHVPDWVKVINENVDFAGTIRLKISDKAKVAGESLSFREKLLFHTMAVNANSNPSSPRVSNPRREKAAAAAGAAATANSAAK